MVTMPSLFVSHGAPTFALEPGLAGAQLAEVGRLLGKPRAIVVVSAHWMTRGVEISASPQPETIYDFGGFSKELYSLTYPAPGAPELAAKIQHLLASQGIPAGLNAQRGLDHGAWVPLMHLYPDADIPTLQVSLPLDADEEAAFALGKALAPLAEEGILIVSSGSLTHNLYEFRMGDDKVATYAEEFSDWVRQTVIEGDKERLKATLKIAPHAERAHPTTEHFLPLLVAAGAAQAERPVTALNGGIRHGVLAMESYVFGLNLAVTLQAKDFEGATHA